MNKMIKQYKDSIFDIVKKEYLEVSEKRKNLYIRPIINIYYYHNHRNPYDALNRIRDYLWFNDYTPSKKDEDCSYIYNRK